jgi:tetratricopeptide (TPR) repeat protein
MGEAYQKGLILFEQRRYKLARDEFARELSQQPNDSSALAMIALCLSCENHFADARDTAEQAIALDPLAAFPHYVLASVLYDDDEYASRRKPLIDHDDWAKELDRLILAQRSIQEALRLRPRNASYLGLLAFIFYAKHNYDEAIAAADEALAIDPADVIAPPRPRGGS